MRLANADFTWPLLPHERVLDLARALEFEGIDLALMGNRSHIKPEEVRGDVRYWAGVLSERLAARDLALADFFHIPWTDFETMAPNHPDHGEAERGRALFADMLDLAGRMGARGMTILPGTRFGDEDWAGSVRRSAEELARRHAAAAERGIRLSVEPHLGSHVETPEKAAHLLDLVPGLELTLDYGHFTYQGIPDDEIEPLIERARHFHCRGGAPGRIQTIFEENEIDFARVIRRMQEVDYDGWFAIEYVWVDWEGCNRTENTCETIRFRDLARKVMAGEEYVAPVKTL